MPTLYAKKRQMILERDGHRCRWCGSGEDLTIDHIVPRSQGGTDANTNLQVLCSDCNGFKGALLLVHDEAPDGTLHDFVAGCLLLQIRYHGPITEKHVSRCAARITKALRMVEANEWGISKDAQEAQDRVAVLESAVAGLKDSIKKTAASAREQTGRARKAEDIIRYGIRLFRRGEALHQRWVDKADAHLMEYRTWESTRHEEAS